MPDEAHGGVGGKPPKSSARVARLARALRDNLSKRKAQQRARQVNPDDPDGSGDAAVLPPDQTDSRR